MIYEPAEDSVLLQKYVKKFAKNKICLDMGSGSGIQAEACLQAGAKSVLATDINKEAISLLKSKGIKAIKSNLFEKVKGKFDLIIFNPPYLPEDNREDKESSQITSAGKKGDEIILRFLKQAPRHLNKEGIILLVVSSLTPRNRINNLAKTIGLNIKPIASQKLFMEELEVWEIRRND